MLLLDTLVGENPLCINSCSNTSFAGLVDAFSAVKGVLDTLL
jgi:hypothetical protein